ncbi:hypothetical protein [Klebsiella variicola]|uniref:hypothetical protein n=1 Tax=Klebsiella variicola TaxID=244366 RepID=UPI001CCBF6A0|nr:hypothetical protein [Klebsiella variicola]
MSQQVACCQARFYAALFFIKHRLISFYCDLFLRHADQDGNVIKVETMFQKGEVVSILGGCGSLKRMKVQR